MGKDSVGAWSAWRTQEEDSNWDAAYGDWNINISCVKGEWVRMAPKAGAGGFTSGTVRDPLGGGSYKFEHDDQACAIADGAVPALRSKDGKTTTTITHTPDAGTRTTETTEKKPSRPTPPAKENQLPLGLGDSAPAIKVDSFVKGDVITSFQKGRVYVVEFWATWCPGCIDAIPHLTKIQKESRNLTIIGVAASERGNPDEKLTRLRDFVKKQGAKMDYAVAYDSKRAMSKTWMEAANQKYIPTAFVVDGEGKIAFIGLADDAGFEPAVKAALAKATAPATEKPATPAAPKSPK